MDSGGAVYAKVPAGGAAALEAAIRRARPHPNTGPLGVLACDPARHAFALVDRWGRSDDMPRWAEGPDAARAAELAALSREVGEVVAFYEVEEGSLLGVYAVWREGALARELHCYEGEWTRVAGEPQPWEAPLFAPARLEQALQDARDDDRDEAPVRAAFAPGRLVEGARGPAPQRMAVAIREALRGPPHGFQPWPRRRDVVMQLEAGK